LFIALIKAFSNVEHGRSAATLSMALVWLAANGYFQRVRLCEPERTSSKQTTCCCCGQPLSEM